MIKLSLAYSTCPNDTYMFEAIANDKIVDENLKFDIHLMDIAELNQAALAGKFDVCKVSFSTYLKVKDKYQILTAGAAMGKGCGPLLISNQSFTKDELQNLDIGIPGINTTANSLLTYFAPHATRRKVYRFDEIIPAILSKEIDAGVIIHESRFVYEKFDLILLQDLGTFWEEKTNTLIPLGGIIIKRSLGENLFNTVNNLIRKSVIHARNAPDETMPYIQKHAQELSKEVCMKHIDMYVNEYSLDFGSEGEKAIEHLSKLINQL